MPLTFSDRVKPAPHVLFRLLGDEAVLVNLQTEKYLGLNPVGARIWTAITDAPSIEHACGELIREYDVEPAELRRDLAAFVEQLAANQLIEAV
jgi:coenzyme PQQ synthesis protein D (PqqD)